MAVVLPNSITNFHKYKIMILNSSFPGILPSLELHMRELVRDFAWQMAIEGEAKGGREGGVLQELRNSRTNEETRTVAETGKEKKNSTGSPSCIPPNGRFESFQFERIIIGFLMW